MKTYYFWVTLPHKAPMKVAEEGRTASEAMNIVKARFFQMPRLCLLKDSNAQQHHQFKDTSFVH